ncbi:hypothetical protein, partial [Pseudomonas oryzihabitans]|uniref:hypothetical protein n=1 Tax=Pseudomonas oryzihabitans TaxID=47885 RepID=UPI0021DA855C
PLRRLSSRYKGGQRRSLVHAAKAPGRQWKTLALFSTLRQTHRSGSGAEAFSPTQTSGQRPAEGGHTSGDQAEDERRLRRQHQAGQAAEQRRANGLAADVLRRPQRIDAPQQAMRISPCAGR